VLNFDYQSSPTPVVKALLDWYTKQFAKIGVQMEVRATDYNRFQDKMTKGSVQIFFWGWLADYPDAENFLFMLFGRTRRRSPTATARTTRTIRTRVRQAVRADEVPRGRPEKQKLIDRMIEILQKDAVWSFGYFPTSAAAYHQWITTASRRRSCATTSLPAARPGAARAQDRRMEPAGLVADPADRARAPRRHRARVVRLAPPRARDRRAHARARGRRGRRSTTSSAASATAC
jgi:hypothetical protein